MKLTACPDLLPCHQFCLSSSVGQSINKFGLRLEAPELDALFSQLLALECFKIEVKGAF